MGFFICLFVGKNIYIKNNANYLTFLKIRFEHKRSISYQLRIYGPLIVKANIQRMERISKRKLKRKKERKKRKGNIKSKENTSV